MKTFKYFVSGLFVLVFFVAQGAQANLLTNGSFEDHQLDDGKWAVFTDVDGWDIEWVNPAPNDPNLEYHNPPLIPGVTTAADGNMYVELDTDSSGNGKDASVRISQEVNTCYGGDYTLKYAWQPRTNDSQMEVFVDGVSAKHVYTDHSGGWQYESYSFDGDGNPVEIAFEEAGTGDQLGMLLDDVSVELEEGSCDETPPVVAITNPISGIFVSGIVDVRGSIEDENPHHYYLVIKNSDGVVVGGPGVVNETSSLTDVSLFSWDTTGFDDGEYTVFLAARDAAGNRGPGSEDAVTVTVDNTAPATPTGLDRYAPDEGKRYKCGDYSLIQRMWPDWDDNTEGDFSHYEYSSFNPTGQGIDEQVFEESVFEYNGSWMPGLGTYGYAVRAVDFAGNKSPWALSDETLEGSCQITYVNSYVHGGGQILEEIQDVKKKDWFKVSFGGWLADIGELIGDWTIQFHNVGEDDLDKTTFHASEFTSLNLYDGNSATCDDAMNFTALGTLDGQDGWKVIVRAGDLAGPASQDPDTLRIELFDGGGKIYETNTDFPSTSSCVGDTRTELDNGNITIIH